MAKYPKVPLWDVSKKKVYEDPRLKTNTRTYYSDVYGFADQLTHNPKLNNYLRTRAIKLRSQIVAELPSSKDPSKRQNRRAVKDSVGIRSANPGGWFNNRATYLITDESGRGAVGTLDYLSQFEGSVKDARRRGKKIGSATRGKMVDRAIDKMVV